MSARRAATIALAVLLVAALAGVRTILGALYDGTVYSDRSGVGWQDDPTLRDMAFRQLLFTVGLPALSVLAAATAFALVVVGARLVAERWVEREDEPSDAR